MNITKRKTYLISLRSIAWCKWVVCLALALQVPLANSSSQTEKGCCIDLWDPWWLNRDMWSSESIMPGYQKRMERHKAFMQLNIPEEYRDQKNPLSATKQNIQEGEELYQLHCATCHGDNGMGEGNGALGLSPSPALLAYMMHIPMAVDSYIMWTVSEGGARFATDMPAYKRIMPRADIWKITTFMRAGFPRRSTETK